MMPSVSSGTRDHQGRAVVQVCARGPLWSSKHTSSFELTRLLQYFHSIPRWDSQVPSIQTLGSYLHKLAASCEGLCLQPRGLPAAPQAPAVFSRCIGCPARIPALPLAPTSPR